MNALRQPVLCLTLSALLPLTGCAYYKQAVYRPAEKMSPENLTYYDYPANTERIHDEIVKDKPHYRIRRIEFPLSLPPALMEKTWDDIRWSWTRFSESEKRKGKDLEYKVRVDFYETRVSGPQPLIIISPILGGDNKVAQMFAKFFARNGFNAAILHRYGLKINPDESLERLERYLRTSVMRARQGTDWLLRQPSVDPERVATFGISFGGMINTLMAGIDEPRFKAHVIGMAGGNIAEIIVNCSEKQLRLPVEHLIREKGWTKETLQSALHQIIRTDTLTLAHSVDTSKVLMYVSVFDRVIKRKEQRNLWKALGEPDAVYFPFGHYTSVVVMPYLAYRALKFYQKKLGGPEILGNQGVFSGGVYTPDPLFA